MNSNWNTRRFKKQMGLDLCRVLNTVSSRDQILIVEPKTLPSLNKLITFSQITKSTPVRKIMVLDDQLSEDLAGLMSADSNFDLIFLIDVRVDITIPKLIKEISESLGLDHTNIVYATWKEWSEESASYKYDKKSKDSENKRLNDEMKIFPHHIELQLPNSRIFPWKVLPIPHLDDDLLIVDVLYNTDGKNLYHFERPSMQNSTREILRHNMVECVESLLIQTNTIITNVVSMGKESQEFSKLLKEHIDSVDTVENTFVKSTLFGNKYDTNLDTDMIVIEREMDPITPLLTQLTYIGILDDIFQFSNGGAILEKKKDVSINYIDDDIWNDLKYLNFGSVGPILNNMAKDLQTKYDSRHGAETVGEIKNFVDKLSDLQDKQKLLKIHTQLSSDALEEVENDTKLQFSKVLELEQDILMDNAHSHELYTRINDLIYEGDVQKDKILKLLCLMSLCKKSIKDRDFEAMKTDLVDAFGIESTFELQNLIKNNYITTKYMGNNSILKKEYRHISSWLNTLPTEEDDTVTNGRNKPSPKQMTKTPREPSFAFCGMVPLSTRLIQLLYDRTVMSQYYSSQQPFIISRKPSTNGSSELFGQIYGDSTIMQDARWVVTPTGATNGNRFAPATNKREQASSKNGIVIVVFLGGITLGEMATLKHLQRILQEKGIRKRFIVVADGLCR